MLASLSGHHARGRRARGPRMACCVFVRVIDLTGTGTGRGTTKDEKRKTKKIGSSIRYDGIKCFSVEFRGAQTIPSVKPIWECWLSTWSVFWERISKEKGDKKKVRLNGNVKQNNIDFQSGNSNKVQEQCPFYLQTSRYRRTNRYISIKVRPSTPAN